MIPEEFLEIVRKYWPLFATTSVAFIKALTDIVREWKKLGAEFSDTFVVGVDWPNYAKVLALNLPCKVRLVWLLPAGCDLVVSDSRIFGRRTVPFPSFEKEWVPILRRGKG